MFELNGVKYSLEEVQEAADASSMLLEDYIAEFKLMKVEEDSLVSELQPIQQPNQVETDQQELTTTLEPPLVEQGTTGRAQIKKPAEVLIDEAKPPGRKDEIFKYNERLKNALEGKDEFENWIGLTEIERLNAYEENNSPGQDLVYWNTETQKRTPTPEAIELYEKYLPTGFADYSDSEQFKTATIDLVTNAVNNDPTILHNIKQRYILEKDNIAAYMRELQKTIGQDTSKLESERIYEMTEKLKEYVNNTVYDPFLNSKFYSNRLEEIGSVAENVMATENKAYFRREDAFLSSKFNNPLFESIYKGMTQMVTGWKESELSRFHGEIDKIDVLLKEAERLDPNAMTHYNKPKLEGRMTVAEKIEDLKREKSEIEEKIKRKVGKVEKLKMESVKFNKADLLDGDIGLTDIIQTVGEALPQIAAVGVGAFVKNPTIASLGLLSIFGQEYGGNYYEAVAQGLKNDNIEPTQENIQNAINKGKYANRAQAAGAATLQTALERFGAVQLIKRFSKGLGWPGSTKNFLTSIYNSEIKDIAKSSVKAGVRWGEGGAIETLTDGAQTGISQLVQATQLGKPITTYINTKEIQESMIAGGIVGFFLPFGATVASQTVTELRNSAREVATTFDLRAGGFKEANAFYNAATENLKNQYKSPRSNMTKQQLQEELRHLASMRNAGLNIPSNISVENKQKIFDLIMKRNDISHRVEKVDEGIAISLKDEIKAINQEIAKIMVLENLTRKVLKGAQKEGIGENIFEESTTIAAQAKAKELGITMKGEGVIGMDAKNIIIDMEKAADVGAFNVVGHEVLHRILFNTLYEYDKEGGTIVGKDIVRSLKIELDKELHKMKDQVQELDDGELKRRFEKFYAAKGKTIGAEESLNLFVDALIYGEVTENKGIRLNEGVLVRIGDIIRRLFQNLGWKKITFSKKDPGRDILNFLKDYAHAVKTGKGWKAFGTMAREGAVVETVPPNQQGIKKLKDDKLGEEKESISDEIEYNRKAKLTNEEYAKKNVPLNEREFNIALSYRKEAEKIASRYDERSSSPDSRQKLKNDPEAKAILIDEILTGKRGVIDVIKSYPEYVKKQKAAGKKVAPLSGYINKSFSTNVGFKRYIEIADRILGKDETGAFTQDVTEVRGVKATETAEDIVIKKEILKKKKKKIKSKPTLSQKFKIKKKDPLYSDIVAAATKVLRGKLLPIDSYEFRGAIQKDLFTLLKTAVANNMGIGPNYTQFLKDYRTAIVDEIDIKDLVAIERLEKKKIFTKKVDENVGPVKLREYEKSDEYDVTYKSETQGPDVYKKRTPTEKEFLKFYDIKGSTKGTRKDRIAELLGGKLGLRAIPEILEDPIITDRIKEVYKDRGIKIPKDIKAEIIKSIKEEPGVKLSITEKSDIDMIFRKMNAFQAGGLSTVPEDLQSISQDFRHYNEIIKTAKLSTLDMTKPEDRIVYIDWIKNVGAKILPREFWENNATLTGLKGEGNYKGHYPFKNKAEMKEAFEGVEFIKLSKTISKEQKEAGQTSSDYVIMQDMLTNVGMTTGTGDNMVLQPKFLKIFGTKKFIKSQDNSIKGLELVFQKFAKLIDGDKKNIAFIGQLLKSSSSHAGHFIRVAAPVRFYQRNILGEAVVKEHSLPATLTSKYLFNAAIQNNVTQAFKPIAKNYFQGPISKINDDKLKGKGISGLSFNYGNVMPPGWILGKDFTWARYFNLNVGLQDGGINPNDIILENGESVFQEYGVNSNGFIAKGNTIKTIKQAQEKNSMSSNFINPKDIINKQISILGDYDKAATLGRDRKTPKKGISVFDFDNVLAKTKSKVLYTLPNGKKGKLSPAEFAKKSSVLDSKGAVYDFSQFNKVIKGKKGPLADLALKRQGKFGSKDIFIVTARPQESIVAIHDFLKGIGLNIPLENITGLEDGSPIAKANWVAKKAAQGYNDFYFADDVWGNVKAVKNVLDQIDVKSKVQHVKDSMSEKLNEEFNLIIEKKTGLGKNKIYSPARAKTVGASKGKWNFWIPHSAEDFVGLLYPLLGKGKEGDAQMAWFKKNLLDPFNRAENSITQAKVSISNDFKALKKQFKTIPKTLRKEAVDGFTYEDALRVYIWGKQGDVIPGLAKRDITELSEFIENDAELKAFANALIEIQKGKAYPPPSETWLAGTLTTDIIDGINKVNRAEYLQEWQNNVDIIFSKDNMNKLEATYGAKYVEAIRNMLTRMRRGTNKLHTGSRVVNNVLDWINGSVGAIMFLNTKSAVLQTISAINFINWTDNNIFAAGKAFANQPQFWKDFLRLFNSDFLVSRRKGLKINVTESEIADAAEKGSVKGVIAMLLRKGFILTRFADSFAIASGGSTFYRNRIKTYLKQGMSKIEAETQAFLDFYELAEENQQSSRTDRISMEQASDAGRVILAFANTPMQYARLSKKAFLDLKNGRGDYRANISKLVYYTFVQNLIFNALQTALFTMMFDDDDEIPQDKVVRIGNGMMDSILRGLGIGGAAVSTVKNIALKLAQEGAKRSPKYDEAAWEMLDLSPPISSKVTKMRSAGRTVSWNAKEIKEKGFSLDNPAYLAGGQVLSAATNIPLDRVIKKGNNIADAVREESEVWQKIALLLGWSMWELEDKKKEDKTKNTGREILKRDVLKREIVKR